MVIYHHTKYWRNKELEILLYEGSVRGDALKMHATLMSYNTIEKFIKIRKQNEEPVRGDIQTAWNIRVILWAAPAQCMFDKTSYSKFTICIVWVIYMKNYKLNTEEKKSLKFKPHKFHIWISNWCYFQDFNIINN